MRVSAEYWTESPPSSKNTKGETTEPNWRLASTGSEDQTARRDFVKEWKNNYEAGDHSWLE